MATSRSTPRIAAHALVATVIALVAADTLAAAQAPDFRLRGAGAGAEAPER